MARTLFDMAMQCSLYTRTEARRASGMDCSDAGMVEELEYQVWNAQANLDDGEEPEYWKPILRDAKRLLRTKRALKAKAKE